MYEGTGFKNNNSYLYGQMNNNQITENNLHNNVNAKDWAHRYGRNGIIRSNILREDEDLLKDHVEQMRKKKCKFRFFTDKYLFSINFNCLLENIYYISDFINK